MELLRRFRRGELRLTRIETFSDGVFAIVMTLLVLELKVPALRDAGSAGELGHRLRELFPKLLNWLISFVIVCKFWLNHHHVLGLAATTVGLLRGALAIALGDGARRSPGQPQPFTPTTSSTTCWGPRGACQRTLPPA